MSLVSGWEKNLFLSDWTDQQRVGSDIPTAKQSASPRWRSSAIPRAWIHEGWRLPQRVLHDRRRLARSIDWRPFGQARATESVLGGKTGSLVTGRFLNRLRVSAIGVSGSSLSIQTISTRSAHTIPTQLKGISNPVWMPDGRAIIVQGLNTEGGHGLFRVDLSSAPSAQLASWRPLRPQYCRHFLNGREVFYALSHPSTGVSTQDLASGALRMVFDGPVVHFALSWTDDSIAIASQQRNTPPNQTPPVRIVPSGRGETRAIATAPAPAFRDYGDFREPADSLGRRRPVSLFRVFGVSAPRNEAVAYPRGKAVSPTDQEIFPRQALLRIDVHPDGLLAISKGFQL
jgi:hypothetical protein